MKKFLAFTLSEVLIAMGVIGVIASLVIPQQIRGRQAAEASARFNTAYSLLAKSIDDMEAAGRCILPACYTKTDSFYNVYHNFFKVAVLCGAYKTETKNEKVCIYKSKNTSGENEERDKDKYLTADGSRQMETAALDNGAFVLNNGMLVMLENSSSLPFIWISIDINGKDKGPNKWGWDLFTFELTPKGLLPFGAPGTTGKYKDYEFISEATGTDDDKYCYFREKTGKFNGITCAYKAVSDADYFNKLYQNR